MNRLEEAKKIIMSNFPDARYTILQEALVYVIKQAEQKQELENEPANDIIESIIDGLIELNNGCDSAKDINEMKDQAFILRDKIKALEQRNKRYEEAIHLTIDELHYASNTGNEIKKEHYIKNSIRFLEEVLEENK